MFANYLFDHPIPRNIVLKGVLGLPENEEIVESTLLPCKLLPGPLARKGKDEKGLKLDDLRNGRVMELDFLFHLLIKVHSPEGDITYKYLYANIECQRYRQGYMPERGLCYGARILSNSLSKGEGFLDQTPVISVFLTYDGLTANSKDNPGLSPYCESIRFNNYDAKDPDKTFREYGNVRVDIIDFKWFVKTVDELVTYQDEVLFVLANSYKLNNDQLRAIEKRGGDMAVLTKNVKNTEKNPEFAKHYLEWLDKVEADDTSHLDTAIYARREGREEGRKEGIEKGIEKAAMVFTLHSKNHSVESIAQKTRLSMQEVQQLLKALETA